MTFHVVTSHNSFRQLPRCLNSDERPRQLACTYKAAGLNYSTVIPSCTTAALHRLERKPSAAHSDRTAMDETAAEHSTATERLIAFESRYRGRHAEEHASECQLNERKVHDARVYEKYGKMLDNTKKTFHGFCGRFESFCKRKGYDLLNTTAEIGQQFLEDERLRHPSPGYNLQKAFTEFKRLCAIRGCPSFNSDELFYMAKEVSEARKASAHAALTRPVDEDKSCQDRNIITSAELQELLKVCADMPDRLQAARGRSSPGRQCDDRRAICFANMAVCCPMKLLACAQCISM